VLSFKSGQKAIAERGLSAWADIRITNFKVYDFARPTNTKRSFVYQVGLLQLSPGPMRHLIEDSMTLFPTIFGG